MSELPPDQIRRLMSITQFEYCSDIWWREDDGTLSFYANCNDFFAWGTADCEPIETREDVDLLEQCLADLRRATATETYWPLWVTELYAARRRRTLPAKFMFEGRYAMEEQYQALFLEAAAGIPK